MPNAATLDAKPQRSTCQEDGDFIVYEAPIFKEHVRSVPVNPDDPDSERVKVKFTAKDMERCAELNNRRIEDTGTFATVVIRHNPTRRERELGAGDRPVVGFLGPFWTEDFGNIEPVRAVYAQIRIYKDQREIVKQYPRPSVEYWPKNNDPQHPDYRVGEFDPISLLGSEPPELDLGVLYNKQPRRGFNYQMDTDMNTAAAPSGSNTFVPGTGDRREDYNAEPPAGGGQSLSQDMIAQILDGVSSLVVDYVGEQMQPVKKWMEMAGEKLGLNPLTAEPSTQDAPQANPTDPLANDPMMNAAAPGPAAPDAAPVDPAADPAAMDGPPGPADELPAGDEGDTEPPAGDEAEADDSPDDDYDDSRDSAKKPAKYQRELQSMQAENQRLSKELSELRNRDRQNLRYQRLVELRDQQQIILDPDAEIKDFASVDDAVFDRHIERIKQNYMRGKTFLPGARDTKTRTLVYSRLTGDEQHKIRDEALTQFQKRQKKESHLQFAQVIRDVCRAKGIDPDF